MALLQLPPKISATARSHRMSWNSAPPCPDAFRDQPTAEMRTTRARSEDEIHRRMGHLPAARQYIWIGESPGRFPVSVADLDGLRGRFGSRGPRPGERDGLAPDQQIVVAPPDTDGIEGLATSCRKVVPPVSAAALLTRLGAGDDETRGRELAP